MIIEHLLIIRFSATIKNRGDNNLKKEILFNEDRLNSKFFLFETFCLRSIINQTLKNFRVIIIYDKDLPLKYCNKLYELVKDYNYIILHKWDINDDLGTNEWLQPYIDKTKDILITTRMDDDDILNININEWLYKYIKKKNFSKNKIISFKGGKFIYKGDDKYMLSPCNYPTPGLFLSYSNLINSNNNIYNFDHSKIKIPLKILKYNNCWGILNDIWHQDKNRGSRMKKRYKNKMIDISLEEIYNLFSK
jgi:hypothetical protein